MPKERGRRLVASVNPHHDRTIAKDGCDIVLFSNNEELRMLYFWEDCWNFSLHQSVKTATGREVQEADFYYGGIGYINEAWHGYSHLHDDSDWQLWIETYEELRDQNRSRS